MLATPHTAVTQLQYIHTESVLLTDYSVQVTLGEEGFFAQGSPYTRYNPFGTPGKVLPGWSERIGQVSAVLESPFQRLPLKLPAPRQVYA